LTTKLELGCGQRPTPGFLHHDRWAHSPHVDCAFDLETLPWPLADASLAHLRAFDVFEHLRLEVQQWLDECYRVLAPDGILEMRLPSWDNPYSYRDPTHRRVFHHESFHYWCPNLDRDGRSTVWTQFGRYYFGEGYAKWWDFVSCERDAKDWRFVLRKP
jgi:SAM-dependent methyltransferase